jgi:Luciferase-like monooxygenase
MPDYGYELRFGTFITPQNQNPQGVAGLAQLTEQAGLDLVTFLDHPYRPAFLDTWTLLPYVAAKTGRVHLSANVLNLTGRTRIALDVRLVGLGGQSVEWRGIVTLCALSTLAAHRQVRLPRGD